VDEPFCREISSRTKDLGFWDERYTAYTPYELCLNIYYKPLETWKEKQLSDDCKFQWYNRRLPGEWLSRARWGYSPVNTIGTKHDDDDEFFYVLRVNFDRSRRSLVSLDPRQGFVVPKGVMHRTRSSQRTVYYGRNAGIIPTGN